MKGNDGGNRHESTDERGKADVPNNKQTKQIPTLSHIRVGPLALILSKSPDGCGGPEKAPSPLPGKVS